MKKSKINIMSSIGSIYKKLYVIILLSLLVSITTATTLFVGIGIGDTDGQTTLTNFMHTEKWQRCNYFHTGCTLQSKEQDFSLCGGICSEVNFIAHNRVCSMYNTERNITYHWCCCMGMTCADQRNMCIGN